MNRLTFLFTILSLAKLSYAGEPVRNLAQFAQQSFRTSMPFWSGDKICGDVDVVLTGEKLEQIEKNSLIKALQNCARSEKFIQVLEEETWLLPSHSPFPLRYDPVNLRIIGDIPIDDEKAKNILFNSDIQNKLEGEALQPAPFGGVLNYRVEKTWAADEIEGDSFNTYFDSFINVKSFVLESQLNYLEGQSTGTGWFRGDTRLVKDLQDKEIRFQAGDVYPQSFGFMPGRPIGGVQAARDFTLDPYSLPYPQGQGSFILRTRSRVRTWVNGIIVKDETLPAGSYDLRDVPLVNGLNNVVVETIDDLGEKRVYQFNLPTSVELLNEGKWKFSLSSGIPFNDQTFKRQYQGSEGILTSGYAQYGFTRSFTLGGYAQHQEDYSLLGLETGQATPLGNFFLGVANSKDNSQNGQAAQASWQLQKIGGGLFNAYTVILRQQLFGKNFTTQDNGISSSLKSKSQINFTLPIKERLTLSLGAQYGDTRDTTKSDRWGWDSTMNVRILQNLNFSMYVSRIRDEQRHWNNAIYAFVTLSFDGAGHLVNAFHDFETDATKVTAVRDNANKLYSPRITSNVEEGHARDSADIDAFVPLPFAEVGARIGAQDLKTPNGTYAKASARFASAITFAYDKEWGAGLSRPVPNSFVLFKPTEVLRDQKISLRSTSPYNESASGPFGAITYTNLLPYQYREIQLDPTSLDDGTTLEQERFVVYPAYRSAHLIPLKDKGRLILDGILMDANHHPLSLKVGEIDGILFFTSPDGRFFIEGVEAGTHKLKLQENQKSINVSVKESERGIKHLGQLIYPMKQQGQQ